MVALAASSKLSHTQPRVVGVPAQQLLRCRHAYLQSLVVALVLCWSPSKALAYIAPWACIAYYLLISRSKVPARRLAAAFGLSSMALPLHILLTPGFAAHSAMISLMTYGAVIFVVTIPAPFSMGSIWGQKALRAVRYMLLVQALWGIAQGVTAALRGGTFDGAIGDCVAGTIRPFGFSPDFSNPMFAVNVALLLVTLFPSVVTTGKGRLVWGLGLIALVLASVMHVLFFLAAAGAIATVIYYPSVFRRRTGIVVGATGIVVTVMVLILLPRNVSTLHSFVQRTLGGRTQRAQILVRAFTEMPREYPWMPMIGLGPGQFSSRAGLIGTGMFFGSPANPRSLPLTPTGMSGPFRRYVLDLWMSLFYDHAGNYIFGGDNTGSTFKPYLSWLSVYTEFGVLGLGFVAVITVRVLLTARRATKIPRMRLAAVSLGAGAIFVLLLGFQENYWEVPQALFVGLMLLRVQYDTVREATRKGKERPLISQESASSALGVSHQQ